MNEVSNIINMAEKAIDRGDTKKAQAYLHHLLNSPIEYTHDLVNTAIIAYRLDLFQHAVRLLELAIHKDPENSRAFCLCGMSLTRIHRFREAIDCLVQATKMDPENIEYLLKLAETYQNSGNFDKSEATYLHALNINQNSTQILGALASLYERKLDNKKAKIYARKGLKINPDLAECLLILARVHRREKRESDALKTLRKLLNSHPSYFPGWYEIGHLHHQMNNYIEAEMAFMKANTLQNPGYLTSENMEKEYQETLNGLVHLQIGEHRVEMESIDRNICPVFIVGMPRSGTTLLANMLDQHPGLHSGGELSYISDLYQLANPLIGTPNKEYVITNTLWSNPETLNIQKQLVNTYRDMIKENFGNTARIIDKSPFNAERLAMLALVTPYSPVIHIIRDGREVSWSNYTQYYSSYHWFSFSIEDGIEVWKRNIILARTAAKLFGIKYIEIKYEELVTDTRKTLDTILNFIGLDWHEECLTEFHKKTGPVLTASYEQVRKDLYTSSLNKAKNYQKPYNKMTNLAREMLEDLGYLGK